MFMRDALIKELLSSDYLQVDKTPLQAMDEPNRKNTSKSYMWVYRSQIPDKKIIVFDYQETRQAEWPKERLKNFKGYLQTDGYTGYDWVDDHPVAWLMPGANSLICTPLIRAHWPLKLCC
jgi:hypothetical protein